LADDQSRCAVDGGPFDERLKRSTSCPYHFRHAPYAPGDVTGLRTAIREWWADPEGCARLGAEGRAWVERNYSLGAWVDAFSSAARSTLTASQRPAERGA
jgi:hypothetical protein